MIRRFVLISASILVVNLLPSALVCQAQELFLKKDQIYSLAALGEAEGETLLDKIRSVNPDLPLSGLTRDGSSIRLYHSSGQYLEILSNELYSLAVYIPQGIESDISRRSGELFRVGRIEREEDGIRMYFGSSPGTGNRNHLAGSLSRPEKVKSVPLPANGKGRSQVVLNEARPAGSTRVKQAPEKPVGGSAEKTSAKSRKVQEILRRAVEKKGAPPEPGPKAVTAVKLPEKPSAVRPDPLSVSLGTARFKERAGRQPRVEPLSKRVTGIGVPPSRSKRKAPGRPSRELIVQKLAVSAPVLDGVDDDRAWAGMERSIFTLPGSDLKVEAAAVTDGARLYLVVAWPEVEPARSHRPWLWNDGNERYVRRDLLDDGVAIRWSMDPPFPSAPREYDLWVWRAGREGAGRYASDMRLLMDERPFYMATDMQLKGGRSWARLDFDKGRLPFEIVLPSSFSGPEIASYTPSMPDGSASDVKSVGRWERGRWVVEMARALRTGHEDDVPFNSEGKHTFVVNLLQGKDLEESPASEVLTLSWQSLSSKRGN